MSITEMQIETMRHVDSHAKSNASSSNGLGDSEMIDVATSAASLYDNVKRAKLMIVDDEPVNIKAVEKHLRSIGYENFVTTTDSSQAMSLVSQELPDLVMLDIMMPQVNGLDLLRQLRTDTRLQFLPVIILTAYCDAATRREALEAGATDFLAKPVDPHELALRVRNVLVAKAFRDHVANRNDQLECEVRRQAEELVTARHEAELRYLAGKAEIATDVLHNVGNALNSVNVGVNLVTGALRNLKLDSLQRAVELLREQQEDLPRFLTEDERGRVLPSYLFDLADSLLAHRGKINGELQLVTNHLEHISAIVATQQKYATCRNVTEDVPLAELLRDVEELLGDSITRQCVEVVHDYRDIPPLRTDRQKLVQVLLNVIKNALESIQEAHQAGEGRLQLEVGRLSDKRAYLHVTDNGVGIPQENFVKIFSHGFTTKIDGHGFGLHSCANIVKELGGSIQAHSDGPEKGATFVLELPFQREER